MRTVHEIVYGIVGCCVVAWVAYLWIDHAQHCDYSPMQSYLESQR